jgi:deoxycytidylate deaminase
LDEYAMHLAFGASLRSGDLSRQVGAVIVSAEGDPVAVGANDVPQAGGGLYWPGSRDARDHARKKDANEAQRNAIVADVLARLRPGTISAESPEAEAWMKDGRAKLKGSALMDITEYGRAVHAEMEAILCCARTGVSPRGGTLYSTTFPCHNCAKHVVAAGIVRVVYVEPYPKSMASQLFDDSIVVGRAKKEDPRVRFEPFVGVGPRSFLDLFSIGLSSGTTVVRKRGGEVKEWSPEKALVRVPALPNSYLDREKVAEDELLKLTKKPEEATPEETVASEPKTDTNGSGEPRTEQVVAKVEEKP